MVRDARFAALLLPLCGCSDRPSTETAVALAARHVAAFEATEAWALRAMGSDTLPSSDDVFRHRVFARAIEEPTVVDAWVARAGTAPLAIAARGTPSPIDPDRMTTVRLRGHGELRVGVARFDDPRTRDADPREVVVLERTRRPSGTETVSLAVGFAEP